MNNNNLPWGASAALPLAEASKLLGRTESDLLRSAVLDGVPIYVSYTDEIVEWNGKPTGRSFAVHCRLSDTYIRRLMASEEVTIQTDMLLVGTPSPDKKFKNMADALLCYVPDPSGGGYFDLTTKTQELRIGRNELCVLDCHLDWFEVEAANTSVTEPQPINRVRADDEKACPETVTLYWLGKQLQGEASLFDKAYRALSRAEEYRPEVVVRLISSNPPPIALVKYWLEIGELPCYSKGQRVPFPLPRSERVDLDALLDRPILKAGDPSEEVEIKRAALVQLLEREGFPVPKFLQTTEDKPAKLTRVDGCLRDPASEEDARIMAEIAGQEQERKKGGYYTIDEVLDALLLAYPGTPEDVFRPQIMRGIDKGELRLYDPRGWRLRAEYHSKVRRSYYELIHVPELNRWFDEVKKMLCQIEFEPDSVTDKSSERFNHDQDWQRQANEIAADLTKSNRGRVPTKGKVANELAKRLSETAETVERRIRKQW